MKIIQNSLIILFTIFTRIGFSQSGTDSLRVQPQFEIMGYDSVQIFNLEQIFADTSFLYHQTNSQAFFDPIKLMLFVPNCSELVNRNGLFYYGKDSLPYCGYCTVLQNGERHPITYVQPTPFEIISIIDTTKSIWILGNFITTGNEKIKIISSYSAGLRNGPREYYDVNGKLYKIEIYKNGKLESTHNIN